MFVLLLSFLDSDGCVHYYFFPLHSHFLSISICVIYFSPLYWLVNFVDLNLVIDFCLCLCNNLYLKYLSLFLNIFPTQVTFVHSSYLYYFLHYFSFLFPSSPLFPLSPGLSPPLRCDILRVSRKWSRYH